MAGLGVKVRFFAAPGQDTNGLGVFSRILLSHGRAQNLPSGFL